MNKKGGFWPVIIMVALAVLLGGGYLFAKKVGYVPDSAPSDIIQPAQGTKDWKTYRNEEYGFEVRYPSDWKVRQNEMADGRRTMLGFVPSSTTEMERNVWSLNVYEKSYKTEEDLMKSLANLFPISSFVVSDVFLVDGRTAKKMTIFDPNVHAEHVIFQVNEHTYDFVGDGTADFLRFYSNFKSAK